MTGERLRGSRPGRQAFAVCSNDGLRFKPPKTERGKCTSFLVRTLWRCCAKYRCKKLLETRVTLGLGKPGGGTLQPQRFGIYAHLCNKDNSAAAQAIEAAMVRTRSEPSSA